MTMPARKRRTAGLTEHLALKFSPEQLRRSCRRAVLGHSRCRSWTQPLIRIACQIDARECKPVLIQVRHFDELISRTNSPGRHIADRYAQLEGPGFLNWQVDPKVMPSRWAMRYSSPRTFTVSVRKRWSTAAPSSLKVTAATSMVTLWLPSDLR